jgi:outer membrane protein
MNRYMAIALSNTIAVFGLVAYLFSQPPHKVAYVDSARLVGEYDGMKKARADYALKTKQWQAQIDTLNADFRSALRTYSKRIDQADEASKQRLRADTERKRHQVEEFEKSIRAKAQQEDARSTQLVLVEINKFLDGYGKAHGYSFILAANQAGSLAFADKQLDITDDVIAALNRTNTEK